MHGKGGADGRPGRYTKNHKPKVNISRFLEKNRTEKKLISNFFGKIEVKNN